MIVITRNTCKCCAGGLTTLLLLTACDWQVNMAQQPRYSTLQPSEFFPDGAIARPLSEGTVSRDGTLFTAAPTTRPVPQPALSPELLAHGQERFNIHCSPCHGADGYGQGMIVQRGYPAPPSYHDDRLRGVPDEYIYIVIGNGLGKMPPYGKNVRPADRWAIIAYVRALQLSQHARLTDVPEAQRAALAESTSQPERQP